MSDFKSTKEIYSYLLNGGKVKHKASGEITYFQEDGDLNSAKFFSSPQDWLKYTEPKPKVKLWQYAYKTKVTVWSSTGAYFKSDEDFKNNCVIAPLAFQRIENSMIEVEL